MARLTSSLVEAARGGEGGFLIVEAGTLKPVYGGDGQLLKFVDGGEAARYSVVLAKEQGKKFQPRRISDDAWQERERTRFKSGEYKELPWAHETWWVGLANIHGQHFPHVSTKNSVGLMAYTEDSAKGSADVQTPIKPGRYLEKYFKLPGLVVRELCARFSTKFEENVVLMAHTPDEIEEVYLNGPGSCMSHPISHYHSHIHPVRVYGAGDLAVAYLKRDSRVVARALVWPEKKMYSSFYGDGSRLEPLLRKEGYNKRGTPVGARLLRIITHQDKVKMIGPKAFVVPHVDGGGWFLDDGEFLKLHDGSPSKKGEHVHKAAGAAGVTEWMGFKCDRCGADDLPANQIVKVVSSKTDNSKLACWCPTCRDAEAFKCPSSGYHIDKKYGVQMWDGAMWWSRSFKQSGFACEGTGLNYPSSEQVTVRGGKVYSRDYVKKQGGKMCTLCGQGLLKATDCDAACKKRAMLTRM